jgi:hypothetical protein
MKAGTSGHWSVVITCENVGFDKNRIFFHAHLKAY